MTWKLDYVTMSIIRRYTLLVFWYPCLTYHYIVIRIVFRNRNLDLFIHLEYVIFGLVQRNYKCGRIQSIKYNQAIVTRLSTEMKPYSFPLYDLLYKSYLELIPIPVGIMNYD